MLEKGKTPRKMRERDEELHSAWVHVSFGISVVGYLKKGILQIIDKIAVINLKWRFEQQDQLRRNVSSLDRRQVPQLYSEIS